jgi:translation initiation factor 3 subunit L
LCYKNKTRSLPWNGGATLASEWAPSSDVAFYIDKDDMIHIADTKISRRYGVFFITETKKCQDICRRIDKALAY